MDVMKSRDWRKLSVVKWPNTAGVCVYNVISGRIPSEASKSSKQRVQTIGFELVIFIKQNKDTDCLQKASGGQI